MAGGDRHGGDEQLELLWHEHEHGEESSDPSILAAEGVLEDTDRMVREGLVERIEGGRLRLTKEGESRAALLVRSHRLAERLAHDVLGQSNEEGACEFEHVLNPHVVDAICTLLGHPRECPHGRPIPPGDCCAARADTVATTVVPLTRLRVGESATVAYVYGDSDRELHKLDNLQIRPGAELRLHQIAPSIVVECERSTIAMDERVAANIHVWAPRSDTPRAGAGRHRRRRGRH